MRVNKTIKKCLVYIYNTLLDIFESLGVRLLYGKINQKRKGWRGEFAGFMAEKAAKARQNQYKELKRFTERLKSNHPGLIKKRRSKTKLVTDYRLCNSILGSRIDDYFEFHFYEHNWIYKAKRMTFWRNKYFNDYINGRKYGFTSVLDDKTQFAQHWKDFFKRKWCLLNGEEGLSEKEFKHYFRDKRIVIKSIDGYGGNDFRVFESDQLEEAYQYAADYGKAMIAEEYVFQTGKLHELNPSSLNTIRVCTIIVKGYPKVLYAQLRVGSEGSVVDNACAGGMLFNVDIDTGFLLNGTDYKGRTINCLPTGDKTVGFQIPKWKEVKQFCIVAHLHAPDYLNLIGWDVCLSEDSMLMIEGNANPGSVCVIKGTNNPWKSAKQYLDDFERNNNLGFARTKNGSN